jgi:hypothetical protein
MRNSIDFDEITVVHLPLSDPRVDQIIEICRKHAEQNPKRDVDESNWACVALRQISKEWFPKTYDKTDPSDFYSVILRREYTARELRDAQLLSLAGYYFDADDDIHETYDFSRGCDNCGYGWVQVRDMIVNLRKLPKNKDIVRTYGGDEWLVSHRLAELMRDEKITGCRLRPVHHKTSRLKDPPKWYQLIIDGSAGEAVSPTLFGDDPWDLDEKGECKCAEHNVAGMNLLSQVHLSGDEWDGSDVAATTTLYGHRNCPHGPRPIHVISKRFYDLMKEHKIKGLKVEPVALPPSFNPANVPEKQFNPDDFRVLDEEPGQVPPPDEKTVSLPELIADTSCRYEKLLQITEKRDAASDEDIRACEKEMKITLPEDYRKLMRRWNGLSFLNGKMRIWPLKSMDNSFTDEDDMPRGMVAFGSDEFGNSYLFDTASLKDGEYTIAEIDHETGMVGGWRQTFREWLESKLAEDL